MLITDLHVPNPADGLAVVTAMRHSQPDALTMLVSGFPDVQSAMAAIFQEANEIIVKPFEIWQLTELLRKNDQSETCYADSQGECGRDLATVRCQCR